MTAVPLGHPGLLSDTAPPPPRRTSALRGLRITFGGLLCLVVTVLVGLAALNSEANLLFLLFGISVGAIVYSCFAPWWMVRRIEVDRIIPDAAVAGRPFKMTYIVRNRRTWLRSWSILVCERRTNWRRLRFPLGFIPVLSPGQEVRAELTGCCPYRGVVELTGVRVFCRYPFGLFSCAVDVDLPGRLIVYPAVGRFARDPWRDHRVLGTGSTRRAKDHSGQEEFDGVRPYREGDTLRWVHWRRSARTGELVVREMFPLKPTQMILLLDPWPSQPSNRSRGRRRQADLPDPVIERVISAAAAAVCDALERGYRVGMVCRGAVPVVIAPAAGRAQRQRLLHELALLAPGGKEKLDELVSRVRWSSGWHARCLLSATQLDETHERVLRFLNTRADAVMLLSTQPGTFEPVLEEASLDRRNA